MIKFFRQPTPPSVPVDPVRLTESQRETLIEIARESFSQKYPTAAPEMLELLTQSYSNGFMAGFEGGIDFMLKGAENGWKVERT